MSLRVSEIFQSIQGESTYAGRPCVFVRLTGCNLQCRWCDTEYAKDNGKLLTLNDIIDKVQAFGVPLVEITGGEPLMQEESLLLMKRLLAKRYTLLLETNGSIDISQVPKQVVKIMDVKTPSSGMHLKNRIENIRHLSKQDEIKFVIADKRDYSFARRFISRYKLSDKRTLLFSPVADHLSAATLSKWILADHLNVRLNLQLHKIIWPKKNRVCMKSKNKKALIVFSGGQDSTICPYWAIKKFGKENVSCVSFDYGQRHCCELKSAQKIAKLAGVPLTILPISTFKGLGNNALTGGSAVSNKIPKNGLPNTFVPGRNLIFLTFAAALAYQTGALHLVTGVCEADYSGYPDCRNSTMRALEKAISLGMDVSLQIHTPLIYKTKAQALKTAKQLGAWEALGMSHTCYNGKYPPCGNCPACILRAKAFKEANLLDPLLTAPQKRSKKR